MIHFWAKTTEDEKPGLSVYDHLINVGFVAQLLADQNPALMRRFLLKPEIIAVLVALHDIGKISPGFQAKCNAWLEENDLVQIARNGVWDTATERDHGKVTHAIVQEFLVRKRISSDAAQYIAAILGAHHGKLKYLPNPRGIRYPAISAISVPARDIDWNAERSNCAEAIWDRFKPDDMMNDLTDESPALWWLAGLTTIADWIGSDERFFSPNRGVVVNDIQITAQNALRTIGLMRADVEAGLSFEAIFGFPPNSVQKKALQTVTEPGVYVIEAPMGMGKTEAALCAAYQLLVEGKAGGIYFALPTQATSNRIHVRVNNFLKRIAPASPASRLIHANSWLMETENPLMPDATFQGDKPGEDARIGRDWFSSTKRALIAPFGVGTIDQALLGVVAAKHFFVRHFALAGKVVILDEVHSYDVYTGTLIDKLITTLEGLGCTVIVLSATLSGKRREQIVSIPDRIPNAVGCSYPLITGRKEGLPFTPIAPDAPEDREIEVEFIADEQAAKNAIETAQKGGSVLWICNTVDSAQRQYRILAEQSKGDLPIGLLHARFPFWRREAIEDEWMARFGKSGETRCPSILVSTQVVEQSVDLDADLMISELAPTDMLLQRIGRLWRHKERDKDRPAEKPCLQIIEEQASLEEFRMMDAKAIIGLLGKKAKVYAPYVLLRSLEVWKSRPNGVLIPSQIRQLIEATYQSLEGEPESWQTLYNDWFGTSSAKEMLASRNSNIWQLALEDREGVQTRINEMPMIALILAKCIDGKEVVFLDGTTANFDGKYRLSAAQAIHRNLVKVPAYCFDRVEAGEHFQEYLYEAHTFGVVNDEVVVKTSGLKEGIRLKYTDQIGLYIEDAKGGREL